MKYKITLKLCNEYYFFTILHINIYVKKIIYENITSHLGIISSKKDQTIDSGMSLQIAEIDSECTS